MKMKNFTKLAATALFAVGTMATSFAQANETTIGSKCGCPTVPTRTVTSVNTFFPTTTARVVTEFTGDVHLTCDKLWTITGQLYVPAPYTLTIDPGTVVQGVFNADPLLTGAIIIERGAKIMAEGTKDCNIVFTTNQDDMTGTYSLTNVSKWGGIIILGTAKNNLTQAANGSSGRLANGTGVDGVGNAEGLVANHTYGYTRFGAGDAAFPTANDADNSGVLTYVSLRHCGALLGGASAGNEINSLSLYSVGSGTKIEHIEVVAAGDDEIEYFGGTVNVKYVSSFFGDDDKFDYDLGYKGKAQFIFSVAADSLNTGNLGASDNGFECDGDDNLGIKFASYPYQSSPQIWNATMISNGKVVCRYDNVGHAGIMAKENAAGSIRNSIFANFRSGVHLSEARSNAVQKGDAYDQWTNGTTAYQEQYTASNSIKYPAKQSLIIKDNVIIKPAGAAYYGFTRGNLVQTTTATSGSFIKDLTGATIINSHPVAPNAADSLQFLTTDGNQIVSSVAGITTALVFGAGNTSMTTEVHAVPSSNLVSPSTPPNDGFFTIVNYKGAFSSTEANSSWLSDFGLITMESLTSANPTDINKDGITNVTDFNLLGAKFGQLNK